MRISWQISQKSQIRCYQVPDLLLWPRPRHRTPIPRASINMAASVIQYGRRLLYWKCKRGTLFTRMLWNTSNHMFLGLQNSFLAFISTSGVTFKRKRQIDGLLNPIWPLYAIMKMHVRYTFHRNIVNTSNNQSNQVLSSSGTARTITHSSLDANTTCKWPYGGFCNPIWPPCAILTMHVRYIFHNYVVKYI